MVVTSRETLRSLTNEAGRQADFYDRRGMAPLRQFWSEVEALAFTAQRTGRHIHVEIREPDGRLTNPAIGDTPPPTWRCHECGATNGSLALQCQCGGRNPNPNKGSSVD